MIFLRDVRLFLLIAAAVSIPTGIVSAEDMTPVFQDDMSSVEAWTSVDGSDPSVGDDDRIDHSPVMRLRNGLASAPLKRKIEASEPWVLTAKVLHTKYKRGGWVALTNDDSTRGVAAPFVSGTADSFDGSGWVAVRAWDQDEPVSSWQESRQPGQLLTDRTATEHDPETNGRGALTAPYLKLRLEYDPAAEKLRLLVDGEVRAEATWEGFDQGTPFERIMLSGNTVMYWDDVTVLAEVDGAEQAAASTEAPTAEPAQTSDDSPVLRNVRQFGAKGNGVHDDGPAFREALSQLADISGPKVLKIPAGTYLLSPADRTPRNSGHLNVDDQQDLTLRGEPGTLLLMQSAFHHGIKVVGCENVRLESLAVDYDPVPFTQGTIVEAEPDAHRFVIELDDGFPRTTASHIARARNIAYLYRPGTTFKLNEYYDQYVEKIEPLNEGRVRITSRNPVLPEFVGQRVAMVGRRKADAVVFSHTRHSTARRITVYSAPALAFGLRDTDEITLEHCRVQQRPGTGRLMSTNADGIHVKWGPRGPRILDCWLEGMGDDSVNIGGTYQKILAQPDAHTLIVDVHGSLRKSRKMMLVRNATGNMIPLGECPKLDVIRRNGKNAMKLTFVEELPEIERTVDNAGSRQADMVINFNQVAANPVIRGNFFGRHRMRGVLMQAPGAVIEDNRFEDLLGPGIRIGHHYGGRKEGPNGSHAVIRDNTFINIRRSNIRVGDSGPSDEAQIPPRSIEDVRIIDNRFSLYGQPSAHGAGQPGNVIWVDNAHDVVLKRNVIDVAHPNAVEAPLVVVNQAANVTLSGTIIRGRSVDPSEWLDISEKAQQDTIRVKP